MILTVTDEDRAGYSERGYVAFPQVLDPHELEQFRRDFDEAIAAFRAAQGDPDDFQREYRKVFTQQVNMWKSGEPMRRWVLHPVLGEAARVLSGAKRMRLFHDHGLVKPAGDGKPTAWHQDKMYWPMVQSDALTGWVALDDVDERNGCMRFAPGSHRGAMDEQVDFLKDDPRLRSPQSPLGGAAPYVNRLPAGGVSFHHCMTYHYAHSNETDRPRRALAIAYMPDGTIFTGAPHYCTDNRGLRKGDPIAGEDFPLVAG
jgi:ectoine hydroxylase-related dioxygenase (phytanoyl-CoA dioxygenase family)